MAVEKTVRWVVTVLTTLGCQRLCFWVLDASVLGKGSQIVA